MLDNSYYITDHLGITLYSKSIILYSLIIFLMIKLIYGVLVYKKYIQMHCFIQYLILFISLLFFGGFSYIFLKVYLLETHQLLSGEIIFFKSKYTIYYLCKIFTMSEKYKYLLDYWYSLIAKVDVGYILSREDILNCLDKGNLLDIKTYLDELYSSKLDIFSNPPEVVDPSNYNSLLFGFVCGLGLIILVLSFCDFSRLNTYFKTCEALGNYKFSKYDIALANHVPRHIDAYLEDLYEGCTIPINGLVLTDEQRTFFIDYIDNKIIVPKLIRLNVSMYKIALLHNAILDGLKNCITVTDLNDSIDRINDLFNRRDVLDDFFNGLD